MLSPNTSLQLLKWVEQKFFLTLKQAEVIIQKLTIVADRTIYKKVETYRKATYLPTLP